MNRTLGIMLAGLLAMTASFAGCASNPTNEKNNEPALPDEPRNITAKVEDGMVVLTWQEPINKGLPTDTTYEINRQCGPTEEKPYASATYLVGRTDFTYFVGPATPGECAYRVSLGDSVRQGNAGFSNYVSFGNVPAFPPAPNAVPHFTFEVSDEGCPDGSAGRLYSPRASTPAENGRSYYIGEWYVNTGESSVVMNYGGSTVHGEKTFATEGEWLPIAISSNAFYFCFYTTNGEPATIALAYPPPQKG